MVKDKVKTAVKFITDFEKQLGYQAHTRGLRGVICGHIHNPEDKKISVKETDIHYLNCGDWIENYSYIVHTNDKFILSKYL
jgi:UDP-2,3-diacylglucosamine pyrophosphatase LpxH